VVLSQDTIQDIAASFQEAALSDIVKKSLLAAKEFGVSTLLFGGGVTNNQYLRKLYSLTNPHLNYIWPLTGLSLDNAAMIAGLGYHRYQLQNKGDSMELEPLTRIPLANFNSPTPNSPS
jgi:N6-L-threonylcarbamoyladenine synthase